MKTLVCYILEHSDLDYDRFVKNNTVLKKDGTRRLSKAFRDKYGENADLKEIWQTIEIPRLDNLYKEEELLRRFESFLKKQVANGKAQVQYNKQSESRYYQWKQAVFRFSSHRYPTGSMTRDGVIREYDMTDSHIIWRVINDFKLSL